MRKRSAAVVGLLLLAVSVGVVAAASDSSFNETESELSNASTTNLNLVGSGDSAYLNYTRPDDSESTTSEFKGGTTTNLTVGIDEVLFDGLVVQGQHDTATELSEGAFTNFTTAGSGSDAYLKLSGGAVFADSFEDEPADSGYPDAWSKAVSSASLTTNEVSTSKASDGSQSYHAAIGTGDYHGIGHSLSNLTTKQAQASIYQVSGSEAMLRLDEGGTRRIKVGMRNGDLQYLNASGTWKTIATQPDAGEWVSLTIKNIDTSADTFAVDWTTSAGESGSASNLEMDSGMTDGYDRLMLFLYESEVYYEDIQVGKNPTSAQYLSGNLSVSNPEEAAINISALSNASGIIELQYYDGSSWQVANSTTVTSAANHTVSLPDVSSSTWRVNVTMDKTDPDPVFRLGDDSILAGRHGKYTSTSHELAGVSAGTVNLSLTGSNATVKWQASADNQSWTTLKTKSYSSGGEKTTSLGDGYTYYRAVINYTYDSGEGNGSLSAISWNADTAGTYLGLNHSVENASYAFLAIEIDSATVTATIQGYDSSASTWEEAGNATYSDNVFSTVNLSGNYSKYRVRLNATSSGGPRVLIHSEGVTTSRTTIIQETSGSSTPLVSVVGAPRDFGDSLVDQLQSYLGPVFDAKAEAIVNNWLSSLPFVGSERRAASASEEASQAQSFYNENSDAITSWVNARAAGKDVNLKKWDTIAVRFEVNGESSTKYIIGLVDGDRYATTTVVNSTTRTVDQRLVLKGWAAVQADNELRYMYQNFVQPQEPVSQAYQTKLQIKYGDSINGSVVNATA